MAFLPPLCSLHISFDVPVFLNALDRADLTSCPVDVVHHQTIVKSVYNAHDASVDVLALEAVLKKAAVSIDDHTASYSSAVDRVKSDCATALRRQSLEPLVLDKALTSTMASRAAASGLNYHHLKLAFARDLSEGIEVFGEKVGKTRRVTASKRIVASVSAYYQKSGEEPGKTSSRNIILIKGNDVLCFTCSTCYHVSWSLDSYTLLGCV